MNWGKYLLSFEGRISRKGYWMFTAAVFLVAMIVGVISGGGSVDPATGEPKIPVLLVLFWLLLIWPSLAVQAKRWHDQDRSAWWILINFVPVVGGLIGLVMCGFIAGTPGPNRFGDDVIV